MDPCQFLRIMIGNLAIKSPNLKSSSCCYCKIKFNDFSPQSATIPIMPVDATHPDNTPQSISACFNLSKLDIENLISYQKNSTKKTTITTMLKIDIYYDNETSKGCGFGASGKLLGRVLVPLSLNRQNLEGQSGIVLQNGWVFVGEKKKKGLNPELYLSVKAQPDPRFVFTFDGEPECSPQVFQVQGSKKQPVFTCKFGCRLPGDWNSRSSSETSTSTSWLSTIKVDNDHNKHHQVKERKGWSITIHDLSGSPVAAASMVTPFVPSQGSDRVSRSNPGAWLILRPGENTWIPWGRLESWRDSTGPGLDRVGHRFELIPDAGTSGSVMGPTGLTLAQGSVPARSGGKFSIDISTGLSPSGSPNSSFDFGSWGGSGSASSSGSEPGPVTGWLPGLMYGGFVMSSTIGGEGRVSKPEVEIGFQHVTCTEDAAVFVALAAAMDLSMDACRPFSHKLRKELRQNSGDSVV